MAYESTFLKTDLTIDEIISIHYFEYFKDFSFPTEKHDFWELIYVDKGEIFALANNKKIELKKGNILFHKPNEPHSVLANGVIAPNLVVISFKCLSPYMDNFNDMLFSITENEKILLANIISEAKLAFCGRLDDPYLEKLVRNTEYNFGSEQLIKLYLEQFLILCLRRLNHSDYKNSNKRISNMDAEYFHKITAYMEDNIGSKLNIDKICKDNLISRSKLQNIFSKETSMGIIDYFSRLKIEKAKTLIRSGTYNFSQLSELLGYTSIHYFSRQFKKITGMSPSDYSSSIKAIAERGERDY